MNDRLTPPELTPMQRQYREIKARHRDKILLFRLGDFYEMFDEDARTASAILNITLTRRHETPMCGFPYHAADQYIRKLLQHGKKVAVCEQVEDPAQAKGIVRRSIVNIITPGTVLEENYMDGSADNHWLCVISQDAGGLSLSMVDVSTGQFDVLEAAGPDSVRSLRDILSAYQPAEVLYHSTLESDSSFQDVLRTEHPQAETLPAHYFSPAEQEEWYQALDLDTGVQAQERHRSGVCAALRYLMETKFSVLKHIRTIRLMNRSKYMELDDFTIRNLELIRNMQDNSRKYSLLDVLDCTLTPMGGRLLKRWLIMPLYDLDAIRQRLNCVEEFFEDSLLRTRCMDSLKGISDLERLTSRIALLRALPRDVAALAQSIQFSADIRGMLSEHPCLGAVAGRITLLEGLVQHIRQALCENPANTFNGGVIREGYHAELDEMRSLLHQGRDWILKLQEKQRKRTGISSLKVKYNKIFGYFIEVSKANLDAVPEDYLRKQSLVNAERYTLPELTEHEARINYAEERVEKLEQELFEGLVREAADCTAQLQETAKSLAEIDVYLSLARVAREARFTRPRLSSEGVFQIREGRHPVVEKYLGTQLFVPNDCLLDEDENRILIITGPNMAGKSTFLRQNALIALMAQMGSFVPAAEARIGLLDRIFTRIGASDQLSAGRSTFLVEMEEAANILSASTRHSLIIMDELGRGTSTYDGLAIAWAVIEYLHEHRDKGGKTLFATHYHELTQLSYKPGIQNFNILVREYQDELIFLRKVAAGPADRSYGIYVAKLAGIDPEIVNRAGLILAGLEKEGRRASDSIERDLEDQFHLTPSPRQNLELFPDNPYASVADKIRNLDLNRITPLEAQAFLSEIKKELDHF